MIRTAPKNLLAELIHGPCGWPDCQCGDRWREWSSRLDAIHADPSATFTPQEQSDMRLSIVVLLACVAQNADASFAKDAAVQLCDPVFAKEIR
jgi:hypothetical protein